MTDDIEHVPAIYSWVKPSSTTKNCKLIRFFAISNLAWFLSFGSFCFVIPSQKLRHHCLTRFVYWKCVMMVHFTAHIPCVNVNEELSWIWLFCTLVRIWWPVTQAFPPQRSDTTLFIFKQVKHDETSLKPQPTPRSVSLAIHMKNIPNKAILNCLIIKSKKGNGRKRKKKSFTKSSFSVCISLETSIFISTLICLQVKWVTFRKPKQK